MNAFIAAFLTLIISTNLFFSNLISHKTLARNPSSRKTEQSVATDPQLASSATGSSSPPQVASRSTDLAANVNTQAQDLAQKAPQLNPNVLKLALTAYKNADRDGDVKRPVLTVIDFSQPSFKQRMWVFNVQNDSLLFNTYVAHGKYSGGTVPTRFSNEDSSKESSLGTYVTADTYIGHRGYSLRIRGLDKGFNDHAYSRNIVVHGAWYVNPSFIHEEGRAGSSWGCPAVGQAMAKPVINAIKGGSVIFAYYPDKNFLSHSEFLAA